MEGNEFSTNNEKSAESQGPENPVDDLDQDMKIEIKQECSDLLPDNSGSIEDYLALQLLDGYIENDVGIVKKEENSEKSEKKRGRKRKEEKQKEEKKQTEVCIKFDMYCLRKRDVKKKRDIDFVYEPCVQGKRRKKNKTEVYKGKKRGRKKKKMEVSNKLDSCVETKERICSEKLNAVTEINDITNLPRAKKSSPKKNYKFECSECGKLFCRKYKLARHLAVHSGVRSHKCDTCGKCYFTKDRLVRHQKTHNDPKSYVCSNCGKGFRDNFQLLLHKKKYNKVLSFKCSYCEKCFYTEERRDKHEDVHKAVYICSVCDNKYQWKHSLKEHIRNVHLKERVFKCSFCEKICSNSRSLFIHEMIHKGIKPYKCLYCDLRYVTANRCKTHQRKHIESGVYVCSHCGKRFHSRSNLTDHERAHAGIRSYQCSHCGKGFVKLCNMAAHEKIHTQLNLINCSFCEKKYYTKSQLRKHILSHL